MRFPLMVFRDGKALPEHGVDYLIVECEAELVNALGDGWREGLEAQHAAPRHPLNSAETVEAPRKRGGRPRKQ